VTPAELAAQLGIPASRLRGWLRRTWPPPVSGQRWQLSDEQVAAARAHFSTRPPAATSAPMVRTATRRARGRNDSDETYVLGLLDAALGATGLRQHRFDWLRGDENQRGERTRLPVDGYWPGHRLVVEYRERQHDEAVVLFDRRTTVSGVGRGEQRRRYDQLRERLIPEHGLTLLVIKPANLDADGRGRLRRNRRGDAAAILELLAARGLSRQ
jgi:hypothetical protein